MRPRRFARVGLSSILVVGIAGLSRVSVADNDPDPWFGRDKALHFSVSAAIGAGATGAASFVTDDERWRALTGAAAGIGAGAAKETLDALGWGDPSWRDLTWDVIGTAAGVGLAVLLHWLWSSSSSSSRPLLRAQRHVSP